MAASPQKLLRAPIVILAGGADGEDRESNEAARRFFLAALAGFSGTLISGGTTSGIAGVAGEVAAACPRAVAVGYLPRRLGGARRDRRYARFRRTRGRRFSAAECLLYWSDLIAGEVEPASVTLLGWGGGGIAAVEYRVALTLGARAGIVLGSGRSADALRRDRKWSRHPGLTFLAPTAQAARSFLRRGAR